MKKIVLFFLSLCLLLSLLGVSALATDTETGMDAQRDTALAGDANEVGNSDVVGVTDEVSVTDEVADSDTMRGTDTADDTYVSDGTDAVGDTVEIAEGDKAVEEEKDFFTSLYRAYEENKGELFSLLSAIVSVVLVFAYQKGLLPLLKGGIGLIEGQVKGLREVNTQSREYSEQIGEKALSLANGMQSATEQMRELTETLLCRVEEGEQRDEELSKMRQCILWQAKLLGEVFLASSLPEYSKERVGRVVSDVESMLASPTCADQ